MPRVTEGHLDAQDGGIEVPSMTQSAAIDQDIEILGTENSQIPQTLELQIDYIPVNMIPKFEV